MNPSTSTLSSSIHSLISDVRNETFRIMMDENDDALHAFMSASAYETAWLAMVPAAAADDLRKGSGGPMFGSCLKWILENQKEEGFWGETNQEGLPTIDALTSTLACLLALHIWKNCDPVHLVHIQLGLSFMKSKAEIILKINSQNLPRWFVLVFPALIELSEAAGMQLDLPQGLTAILPDLYSKRQRLLQTEEDEYSYSSGNNYIKYPPLVAYLETLPSSISDFTLHQIVEQHISDDGSIFQSPSATARAYMETGNPHCLQYLRSLLQTYPSGGVSGKYPTDGELTKMLMVDHVQGLGLAEHFQEEIAKILSQLYRNRKDDEPNPARSIIVPTELFKDALAFRLLRMQGYDVNPGSFCWFLYEPEIVRYMEENSDQFISAMYSVYRATDLSFSGENELEDARAFSIKMLQSSRTRNIDQNMLISKGFQNMINYELDIPWGARLDRLYHRKWIEETQSSPLWIGKASLYRLSCLSNKKLTQLAMQNFEYQQSIYCHELEELKGWSKKWGLSDMGFGREKTVYTYFAVASTSCLPYNSIMRLVIAKSAIIVTVADDFYDMNGSVSELQDLTEAVKRWDGEGLQGPGKTIFHALDHFVNDIAASCCPEQGGQKILLSNLQHIWREAFIAWMVERTWSLTGYVPSMEEYLEMGMTSIAAHTIALPATSLLCQDGSTLKPCEYHSITKFLMALCRLANDIESYQKEQADGKMNLVLLHLKQNPNNSIEDSIAYVKQVIEEKRKEFLEHIFMDDDIPRSCKQVHLSCMKVFHMFFNSGNLFDSETALLEDIKKAIYLPISPQPISKPFFRPAPPMPSLEKQQKNEPSKISSRFRPVKCPIRTSLIRQPLVKKSAAAGQVKVHIATRFNLCFI